MTELQIFLFGSFQAALDSTAVTDFESNKVRALLAYLAVEGDRPHSRDALAGLLWPEHGDAVARKNLRQALSNLRKAIGDDQSATPFLFVTRSTVQFDRHSPHSLDVAQFGALLDECDDHRHRRLEACAACAGRLQRAVDLYRGDFLRGFYIEDSVAFQDWMTLARERYHRQVVQALSVLVAYYQARREYKAAHQCANLQVELDPWREEAHRQLMHLLALSGERSAALMQFERCRKILDVELGVEPVPETVLLYEQIKSGELTEQLSAPSQTNLPVEMTPFVGRTEELHQLAEQLRDPDCRLITLVGPGGVGKTRLALQVAAEEVYHFTHGVYWVSFAGVRSVQSIPYTIADALHFSFQGRAEPLDQLIDYLREKETLLLLDNFEQLLDGIEACVKILRGASKVVLVVTSRENLGLQAERIFEVGGLPYPKGDEYGNIEEFAAAQLFIRRARQMQPYFSLNVDSQKNVARICQLAEGLPLAIELASTWVRTLTPQQIAQEMEDSINILAAEMRDIPERHRSLRATFEHSWELLTAEERAALRKMAVFRGGFSSEAAEKITGASLAIFSSLVEKSLVRRAHSGRYDMHELLRQFSTEKLADESSDVLETHSRYYLTYLQGMQESLKSENQPVALAEIGLENENIQQAWGWAVDQGQYAPVLLALPALQVFYEALSRYREGFEIFTATASQMASANADEKVLWKVKSRQGVFAFRVGEYTLADELLQESLAHFRVVAHEPDEAYALHALGNLAYLRGDFVGAENYHQMGLKIRRRLGDPYDISMALNGLGLAVYMQGDYGRAGDIFDESFAVHQAINDPWGMAIRYNNMALVSHALGEYAEAEMRYQRSLALWEQVGQAHGIASCFNNLGLVLEAKGEYEQARQRYRAGYDMFVEIGHRYGMASCLNNLGNIASATTNYELAHQLYFQCLAIREKLGDQRGHVSVLNNLGQIATLSAEYPAAKAYFIDALKKSQANNLVPVGLESLGGYAALLAKNGEGVDAARILVHVLHHSASNHELKDRAKQQLDNLAKNLSAGQLSEVQEEGQQSSFDDLVNAIVLGAEN